MGYNSPVRNEPMPPDHVLPPSRNLADHVARRRDGAVAGHIGDAAIAQAGLVDIDAGVRATALGALGRIGVLTATQLRMAADDVEVGVRRRVAELAGGTAISDGATRGATVAAVLATLLSDPDFAVVETAAWATGERLGRAAELAEASPEQSGAPENADDVMALEAGLLDALIDLAVNHEDALCREAAVAALGAIGDERALPAILHATEDKATVRRRAVIALAPFDGPEVDAALQTAREDRDWQVRQAAEDLLEITADVADDTDTTT